MTRVCCLSILVIFMAADVQSQAGDFITVRKNGVTTKMLLKGAYATFLTTSGEWIESRILDIKNDTLYFREIVVRQVATPWGVPRLDTVATSTRGIRYTEIAGVPRGKEGFSYIKNGTLFMLGGAGFILLNLVNGAYLNYPPFGKENLPGIAIATGAFGVGFLMSKLHKPYLKIGKKYSLEYIKVNTD